MFMLCLAFVIFMFTVCLRRYLFYMKNGITTAEISPKGIRINNDFYAFDSKPDFSYIDHPNTADKIKLATPYKHLIVKTSDGRTSVYSLGFYHLGYREQKLMITSIDRIMRYIEAYGVPED